MVDADGSGFGLDRYPQIRACGTYGRRSPCLAPVSDESGVAPHVVGVLLTVVTLVVGTCSVLFLLQRISTTKIIRMLSPPLLIGFSLLLAATVRTTTGLLLLLESRMGIKPTMTKRTPPSPQHSFFSSELWTRNKQEEAGKEREKSKRERLIEKSLSKKEENQKPEEQKNNSKIGRLSASTVSTQRISCSKLLFILLWVP